MYPRNRDKKNKPEKSTMQQDALKNKIKYASNTICHKKLEPNQMGIYEKILTRIKNSSILLVQWQYKTSELSCFNGDYIADMKQMK